MRPAVAVFPNSQIARRVAAELPAPSTRTAEEVHVRLNGSPIGCALGSLAPQVHLAAFRQSNGEGAKSAIRSVLIWACNEEIAGYATVVRIEKHILRIC